MKKCPQCKRTYDDASLNFCLDDGEWLIDNYGAENETVLLPENPPGESATKLFGESERHSVRAKNSAPFFVIAGISLIAIIGSAAYFFYPRTAAAEIRSIAVMPFVNTTGNADIEYLADGVTESLINSLSSVPNLAVKARSSVFAYKGKEITPQKVASDLSVQAILNGRLTQRGENIQLSLELVDAASGNQIWGEQYNRRLTDLTILQSELARDVSSKLHSRLSKTEQQKVAKNYTENTEAYQLYLKGKFHWNKRTGPDIRKSIEYFQQAIEKDPSYALAFAGIAEANILLPSYMSERADIAYPRARAAAQKALEIDSGLAEAHTALASVAGEYEWNFPEAEAGFRRAIQLNPNYATAHHWYGEFLLAMGRVPDAVEEMKRAQEADPLSLIINGLLGIAYRLNGQFDQAEIQLKKTLEMDQNFPRTHVFLSELYQDMGKYEEGADEFAKAAKLTGQSAEQVDAALELVKSAYKNGGPKAYHRAFAEVLEARSKQKVDQPPPVTVIASHWARAGENNKAITLLEEGLRRRDADMLRVKSPVFESLKSDPRYKNIVRQVGLPE